MPALPPITTTIWPSSALIGAPPVIAARSDLSAAAWISEKLGNGWMVSVSTSSGTRARIASVACCSHSPASGPSP